MLSEALCALLALGCGGPKSLRPQGGPQDASGTVRPATLPSVPQLEDRGSKGSLTVGTQSGDPACG